MRKVRHCPSLVDDVRPFAAALLLAIAFAAAAATAAGFVQGPKLAPVTLQTGSGFGVSVSLSADGN